ncbi:MAG: transposase zinc-binding domain-containing protein [Candidatus Rokuibacteriota bacterium]
MLRVRCERCGDRTVIAFSCKGRAFCPSCGSRRMPTWSITCCRKCPSDSGCYRALASTRARDRRRRHAATVRPRPPTRRSPSC